MFFFMPQFVNCNCGFLFNCHNQAEIKKNKTKKFNKNTKKWLSSYISRVELFLSVFVSVLSVRNSLYSIFSSEGTFEPQEVDGGSSGCGLSSQEGNE